MRKIFFGLLAIATLAGCAKEQTQEGLDYTPIGENAYMAIELKAPNDLTKAEGDSYESDDSAASTPKDALFFFFDAAGNPYAVANGTNCLQKNLAKDGADEPNVEWVSETVLVIEKTQTVDPAWVIAILNAPAGFRDAYNAKPMADLKAAELTSFYNNDTDKRIVMSNSVYLDDAGAEVYEVAISSSNLGETEEAAKLVPITIYVERVCSKVRVNGISDLIPVKVETDGEQMTDSKSTAIYAKVLGWHVTNNVYETTVKKIVDPSWTATDLGFTWNDVPYFRSYWAQTNAQIDPVHVWTWPDITAHTAAYDYYFENTLVSTLEDNGVDATSTAGNNYSQLIVAVEFVNESGTALDIVKWYGKLYTLADLKTQVASDLSLRIYVDNGDGTRTSIPVEALDYYQVDDESSDNRYECYLKVASAYETVDFVDATGEALTLDKVNEELGKIAPAQIWGEGGYYYTPIRHLGTTGSKGEFGMVRNHLYDITVTEVVGLGTPVYNPDHIITPEKTEDDKYSYIAAKINVLAWRLVSQDVTLQ